MGIQIVATKISMRIQIEIAARRSKDFYGDKRRKRVLISVLISLTDKSDALNGGEHPGKIC
jgi:hypothetical protein